MKSRAAAELAAIRLAQQARSADIAAQALMEELATEEAVEEAKKNKAKKGKKAKSKNKRTGAVAEGKGGSSGSGSGGGGAGAGARGTAAVAAATTVAARPSVAALTAATGRLAIVENEEEKREGEILVEVSSPASAAKDASPPSFASVNSNVDQDQRGGLPNIPLRQRALVVPLPHRHLPTN